MLERNNITAIEFSAHNMHLMWIEYDEKIDNNHIQFQHLKIDLVSTIGKIQVFRMLASELSLVLQSSSE